MVIDGWTIFAHPLLLDQLERATATVEAAKAADPKCYQGTAQAKLLAMLARLIFETIPANPTRPEYRQGDTLGRARNIGFGPSSAMAGSGCSSATTAGRRSSSSPG